ncbi:MAG: type III secretion system chaperone [Fulvimarina manganoxydans]|uniref:type III secretion system chaperone n=1 Tax=Fulvimarina manganoxydans TaxID=937218 RepID=UPI002356D663|nr:type III secretion system chaperone [Fulvimarina manganoxydans]MCK5932504.1 type III secretion system chaperone [Fulvimarina manganoxydans]
MDSSTLSALISGVGPTEDEILAVAEVPDVGRWVIQFAKRDVEIAPLESSGRLILSTVIVAPQASRQPAVNRAALAFNSLWDDVGTMRMGLAAPDGSLLLIDDLSIEGCVPADIERCALRLTQKASDWETIVNAPAETSGGDTAARLETDLMMFRA